MRKALGYVALAVFILTIGAAIAGYFYLKTLEPRLKNRAVEALSDRFDADVELKTLRFSLFPQPSVEGDELTIRHKQWNDPHPLIRIRHFLAAPDLATIFDRRNLVRLVRLQGLEIHIPPRGRSTMAHGMEANQEVASGEPGHDTTRLRFLIEKIVADGALLEIEPKAPGKDPLQFDIKELTMHSVGPNQAMAFDAKLTNPKPPGIIDTTGRFGPWQRDDPRSTPVSGDYRFEHANLGVFHGIRGILSSTGKYGGVLQHIAVDGETDTPDFALKTGGDPIHLRTKFHSVVDGTNGDTILDPVDATFLRSEFVCRGGVVHLPGRKGKTVSLDAVAQHGRIEDILKLVMGGKPILTGSVDFQSKIEIPPGPQEVLDKLGLDGQFGLHSANFTSSQIQSRIETLSDRAQGISKKEAEQGQESPETVVSNLRGRFKLDNGLASFSRLSFQVPGALISLNGSYDLRSEKIDMQGIFRMQATLSETQSGIKHWLLKPFDPLFKKNGAGFQVPLVIQGTKDHPEVRTHVFHKQIDIH
jgi:AsmA-like protein